MGLGLREVPHRPLIQASQHAMDYIIPFWTSVLMQAEMELGSVVKNLPANAGDPRDAGLIARSGRSPEEENDNALQNCCLSNPKDRGTWQAVHGVTKSLT